MSLSSIVLIIAAAVAGCTGGTSMSPEPVSDAADPAASAMTALAREIIELRYDETASYRDVSLRWLELADSRCPIGVSCIWAGQLLATVEVVHGVQGNMKVELLRRVGREAEISHAFGYELRLLDVDPHPKEGVTPVRGDYVLYMDITKP